MGWNIKTNFLGNLSTLLAADWLAHFSWNRPALLPWNGLTLLGLVDDRNIDTSLGWSRAALVFICWLADLGGNILAHLSWNIVTLLDWNILTLLLWSIVAFWLVVCIIARADFLIDSLALLLVSCGALLLSDSVAHFLVNCWALLRRNC